jgi:NAD(P)-dependent dehydrogenase (short-subunit alcohol dehydrogenase family)
MEAIKSKVQNALHGHSTPSGSGKGKTVLITGGSGFVAAHVLNAFLSCGYNVKTTVRNQASAEKVKKSHAKYAAQISFAIVPDVATPGGHDEAVKGVDGVHSVPSHLTHKRLIPITVGNPHSLPFRHGGRE